MVMAARKSVRSVTRARCNKVNTNPSLKCVRDLRYSATETDVQWRRTDGVELAGC